MTTSSLLSLGTSALYAANAQLQTTSNNIANANTPGYSRQTVVLATASSEYSSAGYQGRGVTVASITRATNMFLTQQAAAAGSTAAGDGVRRNLLSQLEQVFGGGVAGLGHAATEIFNAFADVAAVPADLSARQAVLGRLEDFASLARSSSDQIEVLQANLVHDVQGSVDEVNSLATQLAKLNVSIDSASRRGQQPSELLDQRDDLIKRIGSQIEVHTVIGSDGVASVYVGSGQTLVLGSASFRLLATDDPVDRSHVALSISIGGKLTPLGDEAIGGGQIGGLLRFQSQDLAEARNRLGQLVSGLAGALNAQQSLGLDLQGQPGAPLLRFEGPQAVPAATNARDANGRYISSVSLTVSNPAALQASDYRLAPDPANGGQFIVTRLSDGAVRSPVADGDEVDGLTISIGPNAPQVGESFVLKPVSAAAAGLTVVMKNPRGLAAANPVTAVINPANTGTATVASVQINALPAAAYQALAVNFINDAGDYEIRDSGNGLLAAGRLSAGQPITFDGMALAINGVPRGGDLIAIAPTTHPAASNGNALRFDDLANRGLIDGLTVTDAYANAMADVGVRVQGAVAAADTSATVSARANAELSADSGVNLDEEAARLIQFQQSYQAAAKMLQTAQTLFDTLINSVGR